MHAPHLKEGQFCASSKWEGDFVWFSLLQWVIPPFTLSLPDEGFRGKILKREEASSTLPHIFI